MPRDKYQLKSAEVIGRDAGGVGNWITVNVGSTQEIAQGMPVIAEGEVLIGRVMEVFPKSSRVMLLSHPDSRISGITVDSGAQGIIKGEHGLGILLDMVLQSDTLRSGDRLVTSGLGGELPKNLFVGSIQETRLTDDNLYQRASVVSPINFGSLRYIFIIQKSK